MEVKILEKDERSMRVRVDDIDAATANALRRIMLGEIPVMAIEHVDIVANGSGLVDETLAHRLGMIPLKWVPESKKAEFSLEKAGPGVVKSSDLVPDGKEVVPADSNIPIVDLLENQTVKLTALAQLGFGREHAKWQAATVGYEQRGKAFTFNIESTCGLSAQEVFEAALDILSANADEFVKAVKKELK